MMLVCAKPLFYYLPIPRTATDTIWAVLKQFYAVQEYGSVKHSKHQIYYEREMDDAFVFLSVRYPYSRVVSEYQYLREKVTHAGAGELRVKMGELAKSLSPGEFLRNEWVWDRVWRPWTPHLCDLPIAYTVRFEHLEDDLRGLPILQGKKFELPHLHKTKRKHPWWQVYKNNPGLDDYVFERLQPDFESWGYYRDITAYM